MRTPRSPRREYLSSLQLRSLTALAEVVIPPGRRVIPAEQVARNVDRYMARFPAQRKWVVKVALTFLWAYPLLFGLGTLPRVPPDRRRRFVEQRFVRDVSRRRILFIRRWVRAAIRLGQQMAFLGCYSDPASHAKTGYRPFSQRHEGSPVPVARDGRRPLEVLGPGDLADALTADLVVVGSGAAGSTIAFRAAEEGRSVLLLERGPHVDRSQFTEDEVHQISQLYADGALQLSRDFSFQVLQGRCVGGTTVVNNAVCFDLPPDVLRRWNGPGHEAGLEEDDLRRALRAVRERMGVRRQPQDVLNRGAGVFVDGVRRLGLDGEGRFGVVEANVEGCLSSGYCNIGCPFGAKLSMLDTLLPEGRRRFGDRLRILPDCEAQRIEHEDGVATGVRARLRDGRRLRIRAETIVVAGGTIASSWLLQRSGIARGRAGRGLSFNMGSPITAVLDHEVRAFEGLQISHWLRPQAPEGFVVETWFNPVVSQALNMPGWFDDHARNMARFPRLMAAGALVGTASTGRIRAALTGGPDLVFTPSKDDMRRLVAGLKLVGRIFLAGGALSVMPNTYEFHELTTPGELDALDRYVRDATDLQVGTGHPQGGNAVSTDPRRGVVGPDFRVHGMRRLFVCDASVFPTAITVNPQLTVMALAELASAGIAADAG